MVAKRPPPTPPVPAAGRARLLGVDTGPGGPAGGATVRVEQLVGDDVRVTDVTADDDGAWELPGIAGGRYRIRAFRVPDLIQTDTEVLFLADGSERQIDLDVDAVGRREVDAAVAPDPPVVGRPANVVVQVTEVVVGSDGVAREQPADGVALTLGGGSSDLAAGPTVTTGSDGRGRWQVVCDQVGGSDLAVDVGGETVSLDVSSCDAPPSPTTTAPTTTEPTTTEPTTTEPSTNGADDEADADGAGDDEDESDEEDQGESEDEGGDGDGGDDDGATVPTTPG